MKKISCFILFVMFLSGPDAFATPEEAGRQSQILIGHNSSHYFTYLVDEFMPSRGMGSTIWTHYYLCKYALQENRLEEKILLRRVCRENGYDIGEYYKRYRNDEDLSQNKFSAEAYLSENNVDWMFQETGALEGIRIRFDEETLFVMHKGKEVPLLDWKSQIVASTGECKITRPFPPVPKSRNPHSKRPPRHSILQIKHTYGSDKYLFFHVTQNERPSDGVFLDEYILTLPRGQFENALGITSLEGNGKTATEATSAKHRRVIRIGKDSGKEQFLVIESKQPDALHRQDSVWSTNRYENKNYTRGTLVVRKTLFSRTMAEAPWTRGEVELLKKVEHGRGRYIGLPHVTLAQSRIYQLYEELQPDSFPDLVQP